MAFGLSAFRPLPFGLSVFHRPDGRTPTFRTDGIPTYPPRSSVTLIRVRNQTLWRPKSAVGTRSSATLNHSARIQANTTAAVRAVSAVGRPEVSPSVSASVFAVSLPFGTSAHRTVDG